jgi:copper(I)-binding protein
MKLRPGLLLVCAPLFAAILAPVSAHSSPVLTLDHGTVWETQKDGENTQGFLQIHNTGDAPDTLTSADCTIADATTLVDASGKPLASLTIPAGQSVTLSSKGPHLLLLPARYKVQHNGILPCAFTFAQTGDLLGYLDVVPAPQS